MDFPLDLLVTELEENVAEQAHGELEEAKMPAVERQPVGFGGPMRPFSRSVDPGAKQGFMGKDPMMDDHDRSDSEDKKKKAVEDHAMDDPSEEDNEMEYSQNRNDQAQPSEKEYTSQNSNDDLGSQQQLLQGGQSQQNCPQQQIRQKNYQQPPLLRGSRRQAEQLSAAADRLQEQGAEALVAIKRMEKDMKKSRAWLLGENGLNGLRKEKKKLYQEKNGGIMPLNEVVRVMLLRGEVVELGGGKSGSNEEGFLNQLKTQTVARKTLAKRKLQLKFIRAMARKTHKAQQCLQIISEGGYCRIF